MAEADSGGASAIVSIDPRLAVSGVPLVTVLKNATGIQTMNFPSGSGAGSSQNITCIFPEAVVVDPRIRLRGSLRIQVELKIPNNVAAENTIRFGDQIAPRAYPLHKGWSVANLTMGNVDNVWSPLWGQVVDYFADDATSQQFRPGASRSPIYADVQAGYGGANDAMVGLGNSTAMRPGNATSDIFFCDPTTGVELSDGGAGITASSGTWVYRKSDNSLRCSAASSGPFTLTFAVCVQSSELLMFGGCDFGPVRSHRKAGFARIQRANLSFTYDSDPAKVLMVRSGSFGMPGCPANGVNTSTNFYSVLTYLPSVGQSGFSLDVTTLMPAMNVELPATVYHPSFKVLPTNPVTLNSTIGVYNGGANNYSNPFTAQLVAAPMTLSRVPEYIIIYARKAQGNYRADESQWTLPIQRLELQYANATLLTSASKEWLFEESVRSGLSNKSWPEYNGFIQQCASGYGVSTAAGLCASSGGFVVLRPGISFPLPAEATAGSLYQTTISATATIINQTGYTSITPELVMIFIDSVQIASDKGFAREFAPMLEPATIAMAEPTGVEHPHMVGGGLPGFGTRAESIMGGYASASRQGAGIIQDMWDKHKDKLPGWAGKVGDAAVKGRDFYDKMNEKYKAGKPAATSGGATRGFGVQGMAVESTNNGRKRRLIAAMEGQSS